MTIQEQLDRLTQIAATALESIQALERISATHTTQIADLSGQIAELAANQKRTDDSLRTLADELINTQREWQAYLRRIPPQ